MKNIRLISLISAMMLLFLASVSFGGVFKSGSKKIHHRRYADPVSIESFGAVANNPDTDNSPFILKAIMSSGEILIPAKTYYVKHVVSVKNSNDKSISAEGATIINVNYEESTFHFVSCNNIKFQGGTYTRDVLPKKQDGKGQNTFTFESCKNISVNKIHINRSPEMGIGLGSVIGANITNNVIEHCLRDGVYAHYSANLKYLNNTINEIKDDGLSMHDYGIDKQRGPLHAAGYDQAGHSEISGNIITNTMEGVASIGCTELVISDNTIKNTVGAGIEVFNSERLYPGGDARVNNVKITDNTIDRSGVSVAINELPQTNNGQIGGARAAIFLGSVAAGRDNNFLLSKLRLANIIVQNNKVTNSAVNGLTATNVDNLTAIGNTFTDCHSSPVNAQYTGNIVELYNCTHINVRDNSVVDDRAVPLHNSAYAIVNSPGTFEKGNNNRGWNKGEVKKQ